MAYNKELIKKAIQDKLVAIGEQTREQFKNKPEKAVDVSELEGLLADAIVAGFEQFKKDAVVEIPLQNILTVNTLISNAPTFPVTGTLIIPSKTGKIN